MTVLMRCAAGLVSLLIIRTAVCAPAGLPLSAADIDKTVARAMHVFSVPGVAVGIVKDGKLIFAKGYGVREVGKPAKIDPDTVFAIGSNTKAFTAAALAILVDEGKISWDDKVIDHLPDFRLYDPYVTREFTIRDLLTHRSGLGVGAGDLMFYPVTDFSREDIIHGLRYLKPQSSFRSKFAYDNLLYMVAGQIIPAVTRTSWEDFVATRILQPLDMQPCAVGMKYLKDRSNLASPHSVVEGKLVPVPSVDLQVIGPAGSIQCNISGAAKWVQVQLADGKLPAGGQLFSASQSREMWSPQTLRPHSPEMLGLARTHFTAYALGWGVEDYNGYERVEHSGGVPGMITHISLIPEMNLGVLVFTNQEEGSALAAITFNILDSYVGAPKRDWAGLLKSFDERAQQDAQAAVAKVATAMDASTLNPTLPLTAYAGVYHDAWRGDADVRLDGGRLILQFSHTAGLEGVLRPFSGNIFIVRWNDRTLDADSYVHFSQGFNAAIDGMTLRPVSPATGFSFDVRDLDFKKVKDAPAQNP